MFLDANLRFSNAQAITTTAASTNVIDLSQTGRDLGINDDTIDIFTVVGTAFAGGTSLQIALETSDDNATYVQIAYSPVVLTAALTAGSEPWRANVLSPTKRYLRLNYTVVGTMTAGTITSAIVENRQAQVYYPRGYVVA